ncbi:hypothetical protein [Aquipuribacter hungaricus]|uniref:Uncharacterized protein n=1 Tax=Aquipuribacter hungaricus TaxID=545624 RepID=A0ABV7WF07_9MICO
MTLPRSALLAAWAGAVAAGRARTADALLAVAGEDEPHMVDPAPGFTAPASLPVPDPGYLSDLLVLLGAAGEGSPVHVRCVLPAPGDVLGVPGPAGLRAAAVDAGECVVVEGLADGSGGRTALALVPEVEEFGPAGDVGVHVRWQAWHAEPVPGSPLATSVAEADMAFRLALGEATTDLESLQLSSWRPDATAGLRGRGGVAQQPLPPTLGPRSLRLLDRAEKVMAILAVAEGDHGGAVTGWEAGRRSASLAELSRATRAAVAAAVSLPG